MIFFLFLAGVVTIVVARIVQLRVQRDARTRDWIQFLQEDLTASL